MSSFFFYDNLKNKEMVQQIHLHFEMCDGYILVEKYDEKTNILHVNDVKEKNDVLLYGKIVKFHGARMEYIIQQINDMSEVHNKNKTTRYTLNTIWATKMNGGLEKTYIIY